MAQHWHSAPALSSLGLVIGKFYPPHKGHHHLIRTARAQVDRLIVILPHHPTQAIPGELRKAWLEELHPDCEIHLVPDELENNSAEWAAWTLAHLGNPPDIVFSSEDYGPEYAALMNARHVMVDRARAAIPISATAIRADPQAHLDFLDPPVRAYYIPRVVLIGAESTGKTTLARKLAKLFNEPWVPEYGREHWEHKIRDLPNPLTAAATWSPDEFVHISHEQKRREDLAARAARRVLFCDTNAFATATWYERYLHARHPDLDRWGLEDRVSLYLIPDVDVPFVQDGVRDGESIRAWMHRRFVELISQTSTPYAILQGAWDQREQQALRAIQAKLGLTPR